jgi:hypothetical protein
MLAATHFDQLLVFVFFGIAILLQILTKAAGKNRKRPTDTQRGSTSPSQRSRPISRAEDETDEDQIRKFLEALGQPTTSKPPEPIQPRPTYQRPVVLPRAPTFGSPLPPLKTRPPDLPREAAEPIQTSPKPGSKVFRPKAGVETPITEAEVKVALGPTEAKPTSKPHDLVTMLRSTSGLRDAIILREIFGPPRSMQPLDLVGSV